MKQLRLSALLMAGLFSLNVMAAVNIVQCEDEQGNKTFEKVCPPGTKQVNQMRVATGGAAGSAETGNQGAAGDISATLYSVPECDSCDGVREYLRDRNIPITEKNVFDSIDLQNEMKEVSGKQSVPVVVIGDKVLIGYNRTELKAALAAAGYEEKTETTGEGETSAATE